MNIVTSQLGKIYDVTVKFENSNVSRHVSKLRQNKNTWKKHCFVNCCLSSCSSMLCFLFLVCTTGFDLSSVFCRFFILCVLPLSWSCHGGNGNSQPRRYSGADKTKQTTEKKSGGGWKVEMVHRISITEIWRQSSIRRMTSLMITIE